MSPTRRPPGRPSLSRRGRTPRRVIAIPTELWAKARREAKARKMSTARFVRVCLVLGTGMAEVQRREDAR